MKQMSRSSIPCLVFTLLWTGIGLAQDLREQAAAAWELAQQEEAIFRSLPAQDRTRNAHLRIIQLYERVYLTTPHSGYADDALTQIATLYEETGAAGDAIRTLRFLVSDYPGSRHVADAQTRISRLTGSVPAAAETETASAPGGDGVSVDNIRYWESDDSLRVGASFRSNPTCCTASGWDSTMPIRCASYWTWRTRAMSPLLLWAIPTGSSSMSS